MHKEGENRPQQREINKQLVRTRRLEYRKDFQTRPQLPTQGRRLENPTVHEAMRIVIAKEYKDREAHLTLQEREDRRVLEELDYLKESRTMTKKINYAGWLEPEMVDKIQHFDPEFTAPIVEGLKKRPARQAKAECAIQRRGITLGSNYWPLWER
jgi:hypothetical protein